MLNWVDNRRRFVLLNPVVVLLLLLFVAYRGKRRIELSFFILPFGWGRVLCFGIIVICCCLRFWIVEGSCFWVVFVFSFFFSPGERARRKISSLIQFVMQG